ncbi:MAG: hypothetical protein AB7E72_14235 [Lysobacterales bacterium]
MKMVLAMSCALLLAQAAVASPAGYRFGAVADLDGDPQTGCSLVDVAGAPEGLELRISAESDRTRITERRVEVCRGGAWHWLHRESTARTLQLGQGPSGSDLLAYSIPLDWIAPFRFLPLKFHAERLDVPASDALATDHQWQTLSVSLVGTSQPVPGPGPSGLLLLVVLLLVLTRLRLRSAPIQGAALTLLLLLAGALTPMPESAIANDPAQQQAIATDPGNDVGDAGADLLQVEVLSDGAGLHFRVAVNNIEDDGLANQAKVLFIGNSLTYTHNVPQMLQAIALQAGKRLSADAITLPGVSLEDHYRARTAHEALANGHYQFVIMQQGPSSLPESQSHLRDWSDRFNTLIRAGGARPALYMVWPDASRLAYFDAVHASYSNAALDVGGMFIPAGESWRLAWLTDPELPLYSADLFHPSPLGSYAAALTLFASLYRQSPVGLSGQFTLADGQRLVFPETQARAVQTAAWNAHLQYGRAGEP